MDTLSLIIQLSSMLISLLVSLLFTQTDNLQYRKIFLGILLFLCAIVVFISLNISHNGSAQIIVGLFIIGYLIFAIIGFDKLSTTTGKRTMNKQIHRYTELAASNTTVRIWGGDINFFGECTSKTDDIKTNASYLQLKKLAKERKLKIQILCKKPEDNNYKLRIGFLVKNLPNVEFAFYKNKTTVCSLCEFQEHCTSCTTHITQICCPLLQDYCPDLRFRGRIITQNNDADYVFVVNWIARNRVYEKIKIYKPNSRECNFYIKLWNFLWEKANNYGGSNQSIINECLNSYNQLEKITD